MKKARHELILKLIEENDISTQEELLEKLKERGIQASQATFSRDNKELRLIKQPSARGEYRYTCARNTTDDEDARFHTVFASSVISVDYAQNICVLKCHTGTAQAACAVFDEMKWHDTVGTLAGDDTIFLLCRTEAAAKNICETIAKQLDI